MLGFVNMNFGKAFTVAAKFGKMVIGYPNSGTLAGEGRATATSGIEGKINLGIRPDLELTGEGV